MEAFILEIVGLVVLLALSALFSSAEVAYTGLTLTQLKRINRVRPFALRLWERRADRVLATLLLSNNAVNAAVGAIGAGIAYHVAVAADWPLSAVTMTLGFVSSAVVLIFGEIIPKVWARRNTVSWALTVTPIMEVWVRIVEPVARAGVALTNAIWLGRTRRRAKRPLFLQSSEMRRILRHSSLPTGSRRLMSNLLDFSRLKAADVMTHRSEIFAVSIQQPMRMIIQSVIQSGYSRVPVYSGGLDNLRGVLYAKDLLVAWRSGNLLVLDDLIRPLVFVDADTPVPALLRMFRSGRQHLAIVLDRTATRKVQGLVTLQDALETIVGGVREEV